MEIIPAIDLINGECVRLTKGDYDAKTVYSPDPVEVAMEFERKGLSRLHLVDLDGARTGEVKNIEVLRKIASKTGLKIDFSGGISTDALLSEVFDAGAALAAIGSLAVKNEIKVRQWIDQFGADRFLLGADVREHKVAIKGWTENSEVDLFSFIQLYSKAGIQDFFCTDISKDGMMEGPATELYSNIISQFPTLRLIASGGVRSMDDIHALKKVGCAGVIIGKAIYEGKITLEALTDFHS